MGGVRILGNTSKKVSRRHGDGEVVLGERGTLACTVTYT